MAEGKGAQPTGPGLWTPRLEILCEAAEDLIVNSFNHGLSPYGPNTVTQEMVYAEAVVRSL